VRTAEAILAYDAGRYPDALRLLQEAFQSAPNNVETLYYLGLTHLAMKNSALAVEPLEKARGLAPADRTIRYQLATAYFMLERYDKAEPLLAQLFDEQPQMENVGYYLGYIRYHKKDYQGALRALTTGTSRDPTIQQLTRFYTSLTLVSLGLPDKAVAEVDEVLRLQPSPQLSGPAERLRDSILTGRKADQRLHAELRVGGFYDTNVTVSPRPSEDGLAEQLRTQKTTSPGELFLARLDYSWLRNGPWEATAGYSFFQTINNRVPHFNLQDHLGGLGLTYKGAIKDLPFLLGSLYNYDFLTLDNTAFLQRHTGTVYATLVESAINLSTALVRIQSKDFLHDKDLVAVLPDENRDARNYMGGVLHVFRFKSDRHFVRLGYQFDREKAVGADYSYYGHRALVGAQYTLPLAIPWGAPRVRYDYELHRRLYSNLNAVFPTSDPGTVKRRDTEHVHVARLEQPLPRNFTIAAEYQGIFNRSNVDVFDYDRHVFSLLLSWQY
jgi:Tfp pilus assembly protein PilF